MYFYFFETSEQMRNGKMTPTLRALPGQKFPDGTDVRTDLNVSAPKEKGTSANGSRFDYPLGTIFCSTFLAETTQATGSSVFYTVYDTEAGQGVGKADPDFHPVSEDPNFNYVASGHKSDRMNAALTLFNSFGQNWTDDDEPETSSAATRPEGMRYSPTDKNGKARGRIDDWAPAYEDQVATESELVANWMRRMLNNLGVGTTAKRPKVDSVSRPMLQELFESGESADTIASRARFNDIMAGQKMDISTLKIHSKGPFEWYLEQLLIEHRAGRECSAVGRNVEKPDELADAAFIIATEMNRQNGTTESPDDPSMLSELKKAFVKGWTLDDILEPQILGAAPTIAALSASLSNGVIPLPERIGNGKGTSLLDVLRSNPANKRPSAKDGFEVDERTWNTLLVNLATKTNTLITGPTGTGKTQIVQRLCEQTGTPFTLIPMGSITDPTEQLVGKMDLTPLPNGNVETRYDWADFALAIQRPGVVLLDEINRVPKSGDQILFSVLDGSRVLPAFGAKGTDKRLIPVHPDCVFFATANVGGEYRVNEIDPAMANRFMPLKTKYLSAKLEAEVLRHVYKISKEDANNIAIIATDIRTSYGKNELGRSVSVRDTLRCAMYVSVGFDVEDALEIAIVPLFEDGVGPDDPNSEAGAVKAIIAGRFNSKKKSKAA